jgi:spore coat protein U-like protein
VLPIPQMFTRSAGRSFEMKRPQLSMPKLDPRSVALGALAEANLPARNVLWKCQRSTKDAFAIAVLSACALWPARADAAHCTVTTVSVAFGAYDPRAAAATDGVGSVIVSCSGNPGSSTLSSTTGQSGTYSARVMTAGSYSLSYNLYTTSSRTTQWGDGSGGTAVLSLNSAGTYTIYGRIPALQNVGAGTYSDSIVVTLTY